MARIKGFAIRGVLKSVKESGGSIPELVASLPEADRASFDKPIVTSDWYPYSAFVSLVRAVVRARGVWLGGAPLGFTRQGGRLLPDAEGHQMVAAVLELRQQGLTERAIGLQLDMPKSTVHKVLSRSGRSAPAAVAVA